MRCAAYLALAALVSVSCGRGTVSSPPPPGCADAGCDPVASCDTTSGTPVCSCPSGYDDAMGDGSLCVDIDECASGVATCDVNADCINTAGGYSCTCQPGWFGDGTTCSRQVDCSASATVCDAHATCTDVGGGVWRCVCGAGYEGDGATCAHIDGCAGAPCSPLVTCTDAPAPGTGFTCGLCPPGYVDTNGDGTVCADVDECQDGSNDCFGGATCQNTSGGFTCTCPDGYGGDGHTSGTGCTDYDECLGEGSGNDCVGGATCQNTSGGFTCTCPGGYGGDGHTSGTGCIDYDECAGEGGGYTCSGYRSCQNTPGSYDCVCNTIVNPTLSAPTDQCVATAPDMTVTWTPIAGEAYTVEFFDGSAWVTPEVVGAGTATKLAVPFGTGYAFRISTTADGCSSAAPTSTATFSVTQPPDVPDLTAPTDICGTAAPSTSWTGQAGITYSVDFWNGTSWVAAAISGYTASVASPGPGTGYKWRIGASIAGCSNGTTKESTTFSIIDPPTVPALADPTDVCDTSTVTTSWTAEAGVTYAVDLWMSGSWQPAAVSSNQATMTLVPPGTGYQWRVSASRGTCSGGAPNTSTTFAVIMTPTVPTLPAPSDVCGTSNPVTTSWSGQAGVTYDVELYDVSTSTWVAAPVSGYSASLANPGVGSGYKWRISSSESICTSGTYNESPSTFTVRVPPSVPILPAPSDVCDDTTVTTTWTAQAGVSYTVDFYNGASWLPATVSGNTASESGVSDGSGYQWRITSDVAGCSSGTYNPSPNTFSVTTSPPVPDLPSPADSCGGTLTTSWTGIAGVVYSVELWDSASLLPAAVSGYGASVTDVGAGTGDYWQISASKNGCSNNPPKQSTTFNVAPPPVLPLFPEVVYGCAGTDETLTWGRAQSYGSYTVEVDEGSGYSASAVTNVTSSSATLSGAGAGSYGWRVRHDTAGCGSSSFAYSRVAVGTTPTPAQIPAASLVSPPDGAVPFSGTLSWSDVTPVPASGYRVELMTGSCGGPAVARWPRLTSSNTIPTGSLDAGTYYWRVTPLANYGCPAGVASSCASFTVSPTAAAWYGRGGSEFGSELMQVGGSASGGGVTAHLKSCWTPAWAIGPSGELGLVWQSSWQDPTGTNIPGVYFLRWNGTSWDELGGSASDAGVSTGAGNYVNGSPSVAFDSTGAPIVAWTGQYTYYVIYLRRWNGTSWQPLGGSDSYSGISGNANSGMYPRVAVDSQDRPVVAWLTGANVRLRRWDGVSSWVELAGSGSGNGISNNTGTSQGPDLAVDGSDRPIVVWSNNAAGRYDVFLRRWNPGALSWDELGGSASPGGISQSSSQAEAPRIALSSVGLPVVAWREAITGSAEVYLKAFDGESWVELGGSATGGGVSNDSIDSYSAALALDHHDRPLVSWYGNIGYNNEVFLRRWDGSAWVEAAGSASGGGVSSDSGSSQAIALVVDRLDRPVLAWEDFTDDYGQIGGQIYVRRLEETAWQELYGYGSGGAVSADAPPSVVPSLALDAAGNPAISWSSVARGGNVFVRTFDGVSWSGLSGSDGAGGITNNPSTYYIGPSRLAIDPSGRAVVAYVNQETTWYHADETYLQRFNGTSWDVLGTQTAGLGITGTAFTSSNSPSLAIETTGNPIFAWRESNAGYSIRVKHWTGTAWDTLGGSGAGLTVVTGPPSPSGPSLAIDGANQAWVAWAAYNTGIYVRTWSGGAWQEVGGSASGSGISGRAAGVTYGGPTVVEGPDGVPYVAWTDNSSGSSEIYLRKWDPTGSVWAEIDGSGTSNGIATGSLDSMALAFDSSGRPVVAWTDGTSGNYEVYLRRLEGGVWVELDGSASGGGISNSTAESLHVSLAIGGGRICAAWFEAGTGSSDIAMRCHDE